MEPYPKTPYLLLVDDDQELCTMLVRYLTTEGFRCQVAYDGAQALELALAEPFDVVILDVMLPQMNGFEVLRRLRQSKKTPVLMLTARGDDIHSIQGLESGADDYLTKPCNPKVLVARLRAVLRRSFVPTETGNGATTSMLVGQLRLHPGSRVVTMRGVPIDLTSAEFSLLHVLLLEAGQPVSKEALCQKGLGRKLTSYDRSVDIHVSNLRRKLGNLDNGDPRIVTVRGVGYLYAIPREG
ncbi:MAG: response regulator transcription factor [Magnetococcales bacterium]|nr:response regulator transcription factor [Magnetococcales bacterium]